MVPLTLVLEIRLTGDCKNTIIKQKEMHLHKELEHVVALKELEAKKASSYMSTLSIGFALIRVFVSTPMDTSEKLMLNKGQVVSQLEYSRVIGCLIYAMTCTRPDIAFVVGKLSKYTSNPGIQHWQAIQQASKKQTCITGSTMEYEFVALVAAGKEAEWLKIKILLLEILLWDKPIAPISIRCDSAATLAKAYSQMYIGKSGHTTFQKA
ncbi:hypothetical protein Tco_0146476 [Tanacetum coccineum]